MASNSAIVGILRALLTAETAQFETAMKRSAESARAWSRDLRQIGLQATQLGAALTKTITLPILAIGGASAKAAIDFQQSFANVRKTVEGTEPALNALAMAIRGMAKELPLTTDELNNIAALGGQMGVPIDQIAHFTKNVAALGVAVDGISTEDAAAGLAQIGNATGTGTTKIAEMASALVHLGNKSNATEADILEFTKRLVGAGHTVGMTVPEIMAIGTAMANVGINAEAGGTAMSKVISKISQAVSTGGAALDEFARVAERDAETFAQIWRTKPVEALDLFIKGLSTMRARGVDLNLTMGEIGTDAERVADTLKRLSGTTGGLTTSLGIANEGYINAKKHLEEMEKKASTVASGLKVLWNQIRDVGITLGEAMMPAIRTAINLGKLLIPVVETLAKGFGMLPGSIQLAVLAIAGIAAAIGPLLFVAGQMALSMSALTGAFAKNGLAAKALGAVDLPILARGLGIVSKAVGALALAWAGFEIGAAIGRAREASNEAIRKAGEDLAKSAELIAAKEADLQRVTAKGNELQAQKLRQELELLKQGRDRAQQLLDQAAAQSKLNDAQAFEFQGPMPPLSGGAAKKALADAVAEANERIRTEISRTKLTVGQLTKMLEENEAAFKEGAEKMGLSAKTVQFLEEQLQKSKKATQENKKATEELTKKADEQRASLEKLGLITRDSVNEQFRELNVLWSRAIAEGIPLEKVIEALGPAFKELADKAKKSNAEVKGLTETVKMLEKPLPKLDSLTLIGGGTESLLKVGVVLKDITAESLGVTRQAVIMKGAYEAFGLKSRDELQRTARELRQYYNDLVASGKASASDLIAAREKVLEAERAAAGETVSLWKTEIAPAITDVIGHLASAVNGLFSQMLLGAKGFKAGFLDILKSLASAAVNALNSVLSTFSNQLFKGLTSALSGKGFGNAFSGLIGGALGGGGVSAAIPGLATSTINAGGGFAGGFGAVGGGLSGAALATLTAGIGAAVVAGFALYNRQNNVTAKSREEFAEKQFGMKLGDLYKLLQTQGPRGADLANQGLNVIGRKDVEANQQWMKDVSAFMDTVKNFTSVVTSATGNITAGFTGKLSRLFQDQTKAQLEAYDQQIEAARDNADEVKRLEDEKAAFIKQTNADIVANTQAEFDRISRITLGAFTAARKQGQTEVEAIQTVGSAIDNLKASADQFGFAGNAAFEKLLQWRELTTVAAPILEQLAGTRELLAVIGDVGELDQQMFSDLQAQGLETYNALIAAGFSEKQAREAVKPLIEEEIRLAKEKKLKIDEGTQAIIDQMRANGELAAEQESLVDVFKQGFGALLKFLKVDLPAGWRETAKAAGDAAEETRLKWGAIKIRIPVEYEAGEFPSAPGFIPSPGVVAPGAQHGGIFTRPQIIGIGEHGPEAAIPLDRLREFGIGGPGALSGNPFVIENKVYLDGRLIAQNQIKHLKAAAKREGVRPPG